METSEYRERTIQMIDSYLNGEATAQDASDWALKIITSEDFEQLSPDITEALSCLFDLHDIDITNASWVPNRDVFEQCKKELKKNQ